MKKNYVSPEMVSIMFPEISVITASAQWTDPETGDVGQNWYWGVTE